MQERLLGRFLLVASTGLFAYYIVWLLITVNRTQILSRYQSTSVQPFVEDGHYLLSLFPDRFYAFRVPVFVGVVFLCFVAGNVGLVLIGAAFKGDRTPSKCPIIISLFFNSTTAFSRKEN